MDNGLEQMSDWSIREAGADDVGELLRLIRGIARFERMEHLVRADEALLRQHLFENPAAEALIAEHQGKVIGFALFYHNFSTFLGRPGMYLEDIYIDPEFRRRGIGRALFLRVSQIAVERECHRLDWQSLNWNDSAITFYRSLGATAQTEWTSWRLEGEQLKTLAAGTQGASRAIKLMNRHEIRRVLLLVNPISGNRRAGVIAPDLQRKFQQHGYATKLVLTEGKGDPQIKAEQLGSSCDMIVVCGGDGTFSEAINGIMRLIRRPVVGYLPTGTTNDFARSLDISSQLNQSVDRILHGRLRQIDIGSFNDRYFTYIASFGAFTAVSYTTPQSRKNQWGHLAYVFEGIKDLRNIKPQRVRISTGGKAFDEDLLFGAVCNSTSIGGLLSLDADLVAFNDGLFEVLLVRMPADALQMVEIVRALHLQDYSGPLVRLLQTDEIEFVHEERVSWSLDGEYASGGTQVKARNIKSAITMII